MRALFLSLLLSSPAWGQTVAPASGFDTASITAIGTAIAVIIAAVANAWIIIANAKATRADLALNRAAALRAEAAATSAHDQSAETAKRVDGKMEVLLDAVGKQKLAEGVNAGVIQQQQHEADKAAADAATGMDRRAGVADPQPVEIISPKPVPVVLQNEKKA